MKRESLKEIENFKMVKKIIAITTYHLILSPNGYHATGNGSNDRPNRMPLEDTEQIEWGRRKVIKKQIKPTGSDKVNPLRTNKRKTHCYIQQQLPSGAMKDFH